MVLFLFMITFVVSLFAVQFLRGEIPAEIEGDATPFSFYQVYNGFLGIYQVLTSEDWTNLGMRWILHQAYSVRFDLTQILQSM